MEEEVKKSSHKTSTLDWIKLAYWWGYAHDTNRPWWKGEESVIEVNQNSTFTVQAVSNGSQITQVNGLSASSTACNTQNGTRECSVYLQNGNIVTLQPLGSPN